MPKFSYDFEISADSENQGGIKMQALIILANNLSTKELERLAWIVKNDPVKTALAKKALGV